MDMIMNSSKPPKRTADGAGILSRRRAITVVAAGGLALLGLGSAAGSEDAATCGDLTSQKGMRRTLNFRLQSEDPNKHCGTCTFFTASAGGCGACTLLSGGAVASVNVCDSWAAKP